MKTLYVSDDMKIVEDGETIRVKKTKLLEKGQSYIIGDPDKIGLKIPTSFESLKDKGEKTDIK